jgi:hypothetical protein
MFYFPITGVVRPSLSGHIYSKEIPLASGWILLGIGAVIVAYIIIKRIQKSKKGKKYRHKKYIKILEPYVKRALENNYSKNEIKEMLIEKNWPKKVINNCLDKIIRKKPVSMPAFR